ncbi:nephrin isoform X1 [Homalodisca vitripennis]|nr:nephrin isoform X1 [Homalodisca vitripennis]
MDHLKGMLSYLFLCLTFSYVSGQLQYFRVQPKDVKVHEGGEVTLQCEVANRAGFVQWTKDGFALGFSSVIPGFPRYSVIGDSKNGVFNLRVVNASLEDDAEFQCQVGPSAFHKAIRADARLSVISPPSSIEMVNHTANSKIEIRENEEFQLECLVKNSKPAAKIVWYRGQVELKLDKRTDKTIEVEHPGQKAKRYTVSSKISLQPTAEDDYADYTCAAKHEALPEDMPLRTTVQLSVLYPPGLPYIEGYTEGETIRRGQTVELICRSRGGNPPAQLIWYKNGEQIRMAYRTAGRLSENIYTFTADSSDNKAKYRCDASNVMSPSPLKAEVTLTVLFAPAHVTISGPTEARVGDTVPLTCVTAGSNPPADIKWLIGGKSVRNATQRTVAAPEGGWITTSNTTAVVDTDKRALVVICHGLNMQLSENIVSTHTINVLYPPGPPLISGYTKGHHIAAGTVQKISCISSGGNPLATITWYKNDKKIPSVTKITDRSVSAEVTILTNVTDNEAVYKCEAANSATEIPLFETVTLSVFFPPDHVRIRKEPEDLRAGTTATLTCDASSSNPPAQMTWWKDGIPISEGITNSSKPGLHRGTFSSMQLKVNITPEMDGLVYTCQAMNLALQRSVHDAVTMNVLYKPVFNELPEKEVTGVEGDSLLVAPQATGRPHTISYTWTKDKAPLSPGPHLTIEGPLLNFTRLNRSDSGVYSCEAVNSEGSTSVSLTISVQYPATVVAVSEKVVVGESDVAQLWCRVEGNPLSGVHVTWKRDNYNIAERSEVSFKNNTSFLIIHRPTKEDIGTFRCVANNGLTNQSSKDAYLVVKHKPEMDLSPHLAKAASNSGDNGRLICRARGAPALNFTWQREGATIPLDTPQKYSFEFNTVDEVTYESILLVRNVELSDYGRYECVARNELGFATSTVKLSVTSAPEAPYNLQVLNITHDSVTLQWSPGFDGGLPASYRLRYRPLQQTNQNYHYEDTGNDTTWTVRRLQLGTEYRFSVMATNHLGISKYTPDTFKVTTSSVAPLSVASRGKEQAGSSGGSLVLVVGAVLGATLLLINVLLVACCLHRRANKRITGVSEQSSSKSATIEMYAPSSYNETVTGETLSSVSEKSESYSDSNPEYTEDARKAAASTYLIEQIEYPFQYPGYELQHQIKEAETIGLHRNTYAHNGGQAMDGSYYNVSPDPRYVAYPPPVQFAQPPLRGPVPPPDVTVLSAPPPLLSTFSYANSIETEGHLV